MKLFLQARCCVLITCLLCWSVAARVEVSDGSHAATAAPTSHSKLPPQRRTGCIAPVSDGLSFAGSSFSFLIQQTTLPSFGSWICLTNSPYTHTRTHTHTQKALSCFLQRGFHNPLVAPQLTASTAATNKQPFEIHYPHLIQPSLQSV